MKLDIRFEFDKDGSYVGIWRFAEDSEVRVSELPDEHWQERRKATAEFLASLNVAIDPDALKLPTGIQSATESFTAEQLITMSEWFTERMVEDVAKAIVSWTLPQVTTLEEIRKLPRAFKAACGELVTRTQALDGDETDFLPVPPHPSETAT